MFTCDLVMLLVCFETSALLDNVLYLLGLVGFSHWFWAWFNFFVGFGLKFLFCLGLNIINLGSHTCFGLFFKCLGLVCFGFVGLSFFLKEHKTKPYNISKKQNKKWFFYKNNNNNCKNDFWDIITKSVQIKW